MRSPVLVFSLALACSCYGSSDSGGVVFGGPGALQARWGLDGLRARHGEDEVALRTVGYGGLGLAAGEPALGPCVVDLDSSDCQRRAELSYESLTEHWQRQSRGLEQGWTLWEPPAAGEAALRLELVAGQLLSIDADGLGATLAGSQGGRWRYDGLAAWDAEGRAVEAWLEETAGGLEIRADVAHAAWPVEVDPVLSWVEDKLNASDYAERDEFGYDLDGAGDLNGDGFDDIVVGARNDDEMGSQSGSVYLYYGSVSGVRASSEGKLTASDGAEDDEFGYAVAGAGDLDGDGYDDIVVSSIRGDGSGYFDGTAYLYYGSDMGVFGHSEVLLWASDGSGYDEFGWDVAGAGDLNGDGFDEVAVGAPVHLSCGSVYLYYGSVSGALPANEVKLTHSDPAVNDWFGLTVSGAGDLDGDGYGDLVAGAPYDDDRGELSGSAYVYYGASSGAQLSSEDELVASEGMAHDYFGHAVACAGDVDGDGYSDLAVGAWGDADNGKKSGAAYLFLGSASGIDPASETWVAPPAAVDHDYFGEVAGAGDLDGDGFDDLAVGAWGDDDNGAYAGATYLYFGGASGLDLASEVKLTASDGVGGESFGATLAGAGDLDGDGYDDLLVGARRDDDLATDCGSIYLYYGGCRDLDEDGLCSDEDCDDHDATVGAASDVWYADADGDGYGDPGGAQTACKQPSGYVDNTGDCDDGAPLAWTGASEVCDGADNDCDGTVDGPQAEGAQSWFADADGDGFTDEQDSVADCEPPSGYLEASQEPDCDDSDASVHPGAEEIAGDGVDQDCDGEDAQEERPRDSGDGEDDGEAVEGKGEGCEGCASGSAPGAGGWLLLGLLGVARVRRGRCAWRSPTNEPLGW